MNALEWLTKRFVEAVIMAVVIGTIVISLLAMSGEFGRLERLNGRRYPDTIISGGAK